MNTSGAVITSIEPPNLTITAVDSDEPKVLEVHVGLQESDLTYRKASVSLPANASDGDIADALIRCLRGCAVMRSPSLLSTIQRVVPVR